MTYGACRSAGALGHSSERPARNQADAGHQAEPTHQRQPHLPQQAGDADVEHFPHPAPAQPVHAGDELSGRMRRPERREAPRQQYEQAEKNEDGTCHHRAGRGDANPPHEHHGQCQQSHRYQERQASQGHFQRPGGGPAQHAATGAHDQYKGEKNGYT